MADIQITPFTAIYNRFLGKITDDMYMELTPQDTIKDLQNLLVDAIPGFEFPRKCLTDYTIETVIVPENEVTDEDFVLQVILEDDESAEENTRNCIIEHSYFNIALSSEEINILALLMKQGWVQRQVTSIENTRMKYSGADFKMTSQANHLQKLLTLLTESQRESFHMQRLYKRRKLDDNGVYHSNWSILREKSALQ